MSHSFVFTAATHQQDVEMKPPIPATSNQFAKKALNASAQLWFAVTIIGQWVFAYYVLAFYGGNAVDGNFEAWNQVLPHGYVEGATVGNAMVGIHMLFAVVIMLAGSLQLVPQLRARLPKFHRISGRVYIFTAIICGMTGLVMNARKTGSLLDIDHLGMTINALLIVVFAFLALRFAILREIAIHKRFALRLFLVVSGVWFFRSFIMLWLAVNQGPVGFDPKTFTGPAIIALNFAQFLIPLALLELYFIAQKSRQPMVKLITAAGLSGATLVLGFGLSIAFMGMWLPRL